MALNPIINSDFPDPDIIRVGDTFYMASTTMFFMPGGDILKSKDLVNWEIAGHVFDTLGTEDRYRLTDRKHVYARGMWAPSLNYNEGTFYLNFACNEMGSSLLYTASDPEGTWERTEMGDFFYDSSLFFDDDGRTYIVHGNTTLRLTELDTSTWDRKEGGLDRILAVDEKDQPLGYEGSHLYKRDGKYYLFTCHMPKDTQGRKTEVCFICDSLEGEFKGKTILNDAMGYRPALQVAQGGMVDDASGNLYMFMFQDRGAIGRAPVIFPMRFDNEGYPMPDTADGRIPVEFTGVPGTSNGDGSGRGLIYDDCDFKYTSVDELLVKAPWWQFSHTCDPEYCEIFPDKGVFRIRTRETCDNLLQACNTLTQRTIGPVCEGEVTLDASLLSTGDIAGLCAYNAHYGGIGVIKKDEGYYLAYIHADADTPYVGGDKDFFERKCVIESVKELSSPVIRLIVKCDFSKEPDRCTIGYYDGETRVMLSNVHDMYFKLDMFTGVRFAMFAYSTKTPGGSADFSDFRISLS